MYKRKKIFSIFNRFTFKRSLELSLSQISNGFVITDQFGNEKYCKDFESALEETRKIIKNHYASTK